jgi:iron-sulfur cluster assembly protein
MFGIPGKAAVTLTPRAAAQISRLMARDGVAGLRIGVKKGGCAGMEYTMDYAAEVGTHDEVVDQDGARVIIAPMAQMFLIGTEIDYETSLLESGFRFRNPNVVEACGCGESVKFRAEGEEAPDAADVPLIAAGLRSGSGCA